MVDNPNDATTKVMHWLSYGAGVNSTALLVALIEKKVDAHPFRVVFSDTQDERDETYAYLYGHAMPYARKHGVTVRVVEYALDDSATPTQDSDRLLTNVLEPDQAPAQELAALYHERWEIEGVFDEFKTHLRANSTVLRSKTPDLVQQELWGLLLAHFAVRQLMAQAAWDRGLDPDRLSFSHAVRVIKRKLPQAAALPP